MLLPVLLETSLKRLNFSGENGSDPHVNSRQLKCRFILIKKCLRELDYFEDVVNFVSDACRMHTNIGGIIKNREGRK